VWRVFDVVFQTARLTGHTSIISQRHSRSPLNITSEAFCALESKTQSSYNWRRLVKGFTRDGTDCYVGRIRLHISPPLTPNQPAGRMFEICWSSNILRSYFVSGFEICCIFKYVEPHGRQLPTRTSHDHTYQAVRQWSIRQQAICAIRHNADRRETVVLLRPSQGLSIEIENSCQGVAHGQLTTTGSMDVLFLACQSLRDNWPAYVAALHRATEQVVSTTCCNASCPVCSNLIFRRSKMLHIQALADL
jgi:hypothetical protein